MGPRGEQRCNHVRETRRMVERIAGSALQVDRDVVMTLEQLCNLACERKSTMDDLECHIGKSPRGGSNILRVEPIHRGGRQRYGLVYGNHLDAPGTGSLDYREQMLFIVQADRRQRSIEV